MHTFVHPCVVERWKKASLASTCGIHQGCGSESHEEEFDPGARTLEFAGGPEGGAFGVRRPLRFLAFKLGLREEQVAELARILNDLKTERAQASVEDRRALSMLADAAAGESFDDALAKKAGSLREQEAARLAQAVVAALGSIHQLLDAEQRRRLAYLIRTGTVLF